MAALPERRISISRLLREREASAAPELRTRIRRWADVECSEHGIFRSTYCRLPPSTRSTIALAWSPDATLLASTHGDHAVRVFDVANGGCLCTLVGHSRTPWTVKFHPHSNHVLASGSLDSEVRLWDARSGACLACHRMGDGMFAASSISFHSTGQLLAISCAAGVYVWGRPLRAAGPGAAARAPPLGGRGAELAANSPAAEGSRLDASLRVGQADLSGFLRTAPVQVLVAANMVRCATFRCTALGECLFVFESAPLPAGAGPPPSAAPARDDAGGAAGQAARAQDAARDSALFGRSEAAPAGAGAHGALAERQSASPAGGAGRHGEGPHAVRWRAQQLAPFVGQSQVQTAQLRLWRVHVPGLEEEPRGAREGSAGRSCGGASADGLEDGGPGSGHWPRGVCESGGSVLGAGGSALLGSCPLLCLPRVSLFSDVGFDVSAHDGGQLLVTCEVHGDVLAPMLAVVTSLRASSLGAALLHIRLPSIAILTSVQFSRGASHLLLGYGRSTGASARVQPSHEPRQAHQAQQPRLTFGALRARVDAAAGAGARQRQSAPPPQEQRQQQPIPPQPPQLRVLRVLRLPPLRALAELAAAANRARARSASPRAAPAASDGIENPAAGGAKLWPSESARAVRQLVGFDELEVFAVDSPTMEESNAALAHPHGQQSPAAYAYATKQGPVRLLEVVGRRLPR